MRVEVSHDLVIIEYVVSDGWGDEERFYSVYSGLIFGIAKCLQWNHISLEIIEKIANEAGAEKLGIELNAMDQKRERLTRSLSNLSEKEDGSIYGLLKNEIEAIDDNLSASILRVRHKITEELTEIVDVQNILHIFHDRIANY